MSGLLGGNNIGGVKGTLLRIFENIIALGVLVSIIVLIVNVSRSWQSLQDSITTEASSRENGDRMLAVAISTSEKNILANLDLMQKLFLQHQKSDQDELMDLKQKLQQQSTPQSSTGHN